MKVTIFGAGYVGLVSAVCLAELGHRALCVDTNAEKVAMLNLGEPPIYEAGLEEKLQKNLATKQLQFSELSPNVIANSDVIFIAVGTPPAHDGGVDLQYVLKVAEFIGRNLKKPALIVNKSTVPVGTAQLVTKTIRQNLSANISFEVISNPEFLREGCAIKDFMAPERIIIGSDSSHAIETMRELYANILATGNVQFITMSTTSAELTKYAANSFLAMKISFINEIAELADQFGANITEIKTGIGSDTRIGKLFLNAGVGYGGSCFPKDVSGLIHQATKAGCEPTLLKAVMQRNALQKNVLIKKISAYFNCEDFTGKTFAVWGLAFKPDTDDVREASSLDVIENLLKSGANVKAYDPMAINNFTQLFEHTSSNLHFTNSANAALQDADALIILTEWREFIEADLAQIKKSLKNPVIFDGRNIYADNIKSQVNLDYFGIGISRETV